MRRRTFIGLSTFSAASLASILKYGCAPKAVDKSLGQPISLSKILDTKLIREIGLDYRKKFPAEDDLHELAELLTNENSLDKMTDSIGIRSTLDKRTEMDFDNGKTVVINGWVLAENEARQCALFSFLQN